MQALIKFRLLVKQLKPEEIHTFLKKLSKDEIISHIFNSFLYIYQKTANQQHDEIVNINNIISDIITTRKINKSNDKSNTNTNVSDDVPNKPLTIDTMPPEMIGECASYLNVWEYLDFAQCNRALYVACNSPSTLKSLVMEDVNYKSNVSKFPLLEELWINPSRFNQYVQLHPNLNQLTHLKFISLDNNKQIGHSEIKTFMSTKCIDFSSIQRLECQSFGSSEQLYDFDSFCKILAKFPNVSKLDVDDVYLTPFNGKNDDEIKKLLPKLKILNFGGDDQYALMLRNKLIETHSKQIVSLEYGEHINNMLIPPSLKLIEISALSPNLASLTKLIKITNNLQRFTVNVSGVELCKKMEDEKMRNIINTIFMKQKELNQFTFGISYDEIGKITEYIEYGLFHSSEIERDSIKIIYKIFPIESNAKSQIPMKQIVLCFVRILNALNASETKHFMIICECYGDTESIDNQQKMELLQRLKRKHLVFDEINDETVNENYQRIVISNQNCKINGYQEIWMK